MEMDPESDECFLLNCWTFRMKITNFSVTYYIYLLVWCFCKRNHAWFEIPSIVLHENCEEYQLYEIAAEYTLTISILLYFCVYTVQYTFSIVIFTLSILLGRNEHRNASHWCCFHRFWSILTWGWYYTWWHSFVEYVW